MKKTFIYFITLVMGIILIELMYKLNIVELFLLATCLVIIYYFAYKLVLYENEKRFVEKNLLVAKGMLLNSKRFIMLVVKDDEIIWCNEFAYEEFPALLSSRKIDVISLNNTVDNKFSHNNKTYECDRNGDLFVIENVTKEVRAMKSLFENKPNIAILQLDNYDYLTQQLTDAEFINLEVNFRQRLLKIFDEDEIYHIQISKDRYLFFFHTSFLTNFKNGRFKELNQILELDNNRNFSITYSIGVATNFKNVKEVGIMAERALDLANSRGGSQTIIFDDQKQEFYGGRVSVVSGSVKMKAKIMANTTINIISNYDVIYLMSHKFPDSDAIASLALMERLIVKADKEVKILVDKQCSSSLYEMLCEVLNNEILHDTVVDKTKKNVVLVLDTQAKDFVSHGEILKQIDDKIVIDHHQTPINRITDPIFNWIEPNISSTSELLLEMLCTLNINITDKPLAKLVLLGILTDTSNFEYRTSQATFENVASLISTGISLSEVRKLMNLDHENSIRVNKLLTESYLMDDFAILRVQLVNDDTLLSICADELVKAQKIRASVVISEIKDNLSKVKVRTDGSLNAKVLIEEFGGGGHARQAAALLDDQKVYLLLDKIKNLKE